MLGRGKKKREGRKGKKREEKGKKKGRSRMISVY
jgi:hypothetical protein